MKFNPYLYLATAIVFEIMGTLFLQASHQLTRPWQTLGMFASYCVSVFLLSLALKTIPVGIAYATWSGLGIALIALCGFVVFKQKFDLPALIGIALISIGVVIINGFSDSTLV